jgi:hypothetical protein
LLVSLRNLNAVGILDRQTRRFKWVSAGAAIGQHSPRFYDGGVLLVDNRGGDRRLGGTQLVKVDLERGLPEVVFPRPGVAMPGPCHTVTGGHLDLNADGKRVLFALTNSGAIWEIDLSTGQVLWEYSYYLPDPYGGRAGSNTAIFVDDPAFLRNREKP